MTGAVSQGHRPGRHRAVARRLFPDMNYMYDGVSENCTRHYTRGLRRSLRRMDAVGARMDYPRGGRCERSGPGKGGDTDPVRVCGPCISDQRRPPTGRLRLRLGAAARAEKGVTVCDASGIGLLLAATRPPLLCHLRVSAHGMGDLPSQVKSSLRPIVEP